MVPLVLVKGGGGPHVQGSACQHLTEVSHHGPCVHVSTLGGGWGGRAVATLGF